MAAWIWIVIAVGGVVVLAAIVFGARRTRQRQLEERREHAQELRQQAETHTRRAEEREHIAQEHAQQAQESRKVAAEVGARADRVDPDRETPEDE
jgi:flagellar biosynthesis/type III secretory pathway M-ring protein FliF/YscJ